MAVLRPDQAQLTIMRETSSGADPDRLAITNVRTGAGADTVLDAAGPANYPPGTTKIYVSDTRLKEPGDFITIGPPTPTDANGSVPSTDATAHSGHTEIRRIEHVEQDSGTGNKGWFFLDRPLAFNHNQVNYSGGSTTRVQPVLSILSPDADVLLATSKHIKFVPGVYDTIDTPDPVMAIEPRYFLGQSSMRNFTSVYSGQHTYQGALNGIILLNGWPLRWGIGTEVPIPRQLTDTNQNVTGGISPGDVWVKTSNTAHTGANWAIGAPHFVGYQADGYNLTEIDPSLATATNPPEINVVKRIVPSNAWVEYEHPFKYSHPNLADIHLVTPESGVTHYILEQNDLDSLCLHLGMKDSVENNLQRFDRRWLGGKVGAMSILAEEGGLLTVNWDSLVFKDMIHNQASHTAGVSRYPNAGEMAVEDGTILAAQGMPGYAIMNKYDVADIKLPTTEPYYFSGGSVKLIDGTEFARVRGFNIAINNNEDPRYYIGQRHGDHKGPSEIREQRREYSMTCTLALPDTGSNTVVGTATNLDKATSLFKELLLEGRYTANGGHAGFAISLKFVRGTFQDNGAHTWEDAIWIDIPGLDRSDLTTEFSGHHGTLASGDHDPGSLGKALSGTVNSGGAFIRSAPHTITTDAPLQVAVDMIFRNMTIVVRDQEAYYP